MESRFRRQAESLEERIGEHDNFLEELKDGIPRQLSRTRGAGESLGDPKHATRRNASRSSVSANADSGTRADHRSAACGGPGRQPDRVIRLAARIVGDYRWNFACAGTTVAFTEELRGNYVEHASDLVE